MKVLSVFNHAVPRRQPDLRFTASVGLSLYPKDGSDPKTIIRYADAAMSRAKEADRNDYQFFAPR